MDLQSIDTTSSSQNFSQIKGFVDIPDYTMDGSTLFDRLDFSKTPAAMTAEDKIIWRILSTAAPQTTSEKQDDGIVDTDEYISVLEFTNNYKRYQASFKRFNVTAEEFYFILHQNNKNNEKAFARKATTATAVNIIKLSSDGVCRINKLPFELRLRLVEFAGI